MNPSGNSIGHTIWHVVFALIAVGVPLALKVLPTETLNLTLGGILLLLEDWARHAAGE